MAGYGWALGVHVLLRGVPMNAQFPGYSSNGQSLSLSLLHRLPPGRLQWRGLSSWRAYRFANSSGAIGTGDSNELSDMVDLVRRR